MYFGLEGFYVILLTYFWAFEMQIIISTQKKVVLKEEENAHSKFLSQFPLNLRVFLSL